MARVSGVSCKSLSIKLLMAYALFEDNRILTPDATPETRPPYEKGRSGPFSMGIRCRVSVSAARAAFPGELQPREWSYGESSCSRLAGW